MTKQAEVQSIDNMNTLDADRDLREALADTLVGLLSIDKKLTVKDLAVKINEIIEVVNSLDKSSSSGDTVRDIKSDRAMTEDDARSVLIGDLKDVSTKEAALELGLSYGQVYSCRKGFTFKKVYKEFRELKAE